MEIRVTQSKNFADEVAKFKRLRHHLRRHELEMVQEFRDAGYTWQQLADELGISKQACQQRFTDKK